MALRKVGDRLAAAYSREIMLGSTPQF
jgi:hypothetical protein